MGGIKIVDGSTSIQAMPISHHFTRRLLLKDPLAAYVLTKRSFITTSTTEDLMKQVEVGFPAETLVLLITLRIDIPQMVLVTVATSHVSATIDSENKVPIIGTMTNAVSRSSPIAMTSSLQKSTLEAPTMKPLLTKGLAPMQCPILHQDHHQRRLRPLRDLTLATVLTTIATNRHSTL
jgi:hypothetical protein